MNVDELFAPMSQEERSIRNSIIKVQSSYDEANEILKSASGYFRIFADEHVEHVPNIDFDIQDDVNTIVLKSPDILKVLKLINDKTMMMLPQIPELDQEVQRQMHFFAESIDFFRSEQEELIAFVYYTVAKILKMCWNHVVENRIMNHRIEMFLEEFNQYYPSPYKKMDEACREVKDILMNPNPSDRMMGKWVFH